MSLMNSALRFVSRLARNPRVQREAQKLARQGWNAWQKRGGTGDQAGVGEAPASSRRAGSGRATSSRGGGNASGAAVPRQGVLGDRDPAEPVAMTYEPNPDGHPDPGEIVWAWVPYEEDYSKGKDRPLLVLAEEGSGSNAVTVGLMLTSRDRGRGDHTDAHSNRWVDVGSGDWDSQGRESEVRIDRLIQVRSADVRREGGRLDRGKFDRVAKATRDEHGW